MNRQRRGFSIYSLPKYLLNFAGTAAKVFAFFFIIISVLTLAESVGQTFNPKITVDAHSSNGRINPNLFGYSTSSEFQYNAQLVQALNNNPVQSLRLTAPKDAGKRFITKVDNGVYDIIASDDTSYTAFTEYLVKVDVSGSLITVSIDDQQVFQVNDSRFTSGEVGLFSSYNQDVYFDDVVVRNNDGSVIFSDSFEGSASSSWNTNGYPSWFDNGSWYIENGRYRHTGQQSLAIQKIGDAGWTNYSIEAKITPASVSAYEQGFVGISFHHQDPLSGYRFMWQGDLPKPYSSNNPWAATDFDGQINTARDASLQPQALVNLRGTPEDAANLVYDLNVQKELGVEYFELGNEIWAFGDSHMPPGTYADEIAQYAQKMKAVDPTIKLGASVLVGFSNWDIELIQKASKDLDFLVLHYYPPTSGNRHTSDLQLLASTYSFGNAFASSYNSGSKGQIEQTKDLLRQYAPTHADRMEILITEFNTHDDSRGKNLSFGLAAADMIGHAIENDAERLQFHALQNSSSHWHPFTNDYRPRPSALAMSLFSEHFGDTKLSVSHTDIPTFDISGLDSLPNLSNVPYLTTFASKNAAGNKVYIAAVNKHELATMSTEIDITNADVSRNAKTYTLTGASLQSNNESGSNVTIQEGNISFASSDFTYNFPAHSATIIELDVNIKVPQAPTPEPEPPTETVNTPILSPETIDYSNAIGGEPRGETRIIAGALKGGNPHLKTFDRFGNQTDHSFFAFDSNFRGGVDVALADVNGDGNNDLIVGAGPGGGPHVRIFDHTGKEIFNFFPFHPDFRGGVSVAGGDIDGDGKDEVITSQKSKGQAWVKAYKVQSGAPIVSYFNAFGNVESGADVTAGDVDRDGKDEIIVGAGRGGGPLIRVYDENSQVKPIQFFAFHPNYRGGISVAAGDADGDGKDEIIASQSGTEQAWVKVYRYNNQKSVIGEWKAFGDFEVGGNVGASDIDNDGIDEVLVGAGLGGGPQVRGFEPTGKPLSLNFFVFDERFRGGIDVAGN